MIYIIVSSKISLLFDKIIVKTPNLAQLTLSKGKKRKGKEEGRFYEPVLISIFIYTCNPLVMNEFYHVASKFGGLYSDFSEHKKKFGTK